MEIITITGTVLGNSVQKKDKMGNPYMYFYVSCKSKSMSGEDKETVYRCACYSTTYSEYLNGEAVCLSGNLSITVKKNREGNDEINCNILVKQIDKAL